MLETNDLLVKCPKCSTWPMAVSSGKDTFSQREIAFKCPKCGTEEAGRTAVEAEDEVATHELVGGGGKVRARPVGESWPVRDVKDALKDG